ncbi:hypothetical protein [Caballeronia glebae]|uniref:hypothetical protein n=1 Tax=Caballeronia glebae TaxID=1777143 RepID=UPI0038BCE87A
MAAWSEKEIATLRRLIAKRQLKRSMHLLPGRTYVAAVTKARDLNVSSVPLGERVRDLMADGVERTSHEIGEALRASKKQVAAFMRTVTNPDGEQEFHVVRVAPGKFPMLVYALGSGANARISAAAVVRKDPASAKDRMCNAKLDQRYRNKFAWWPRADVAVVSAMNAMVSAGRAAA